MKLYLLTLLCLQLALAAPTGETVEHKAEGYETADDEPKWHIQERNYTDCTDCIAWDPEREAVFSICDFYDSRKITKVELENGKARLDQFENTLEKQFIKVDKNGDGILDSDEIELADDLNMELLTSIVSNCDVNYDGKISEEELKNAIDRVTGVLILVDSLVEKWDENRDGIINRTEFREITCTFNDFKQTVLFEFAACLSNGGNITADISMSKDNFKEGINKIKDILESLLKNFKEVDANKNELIDRNELISKLVTMEAIEDMMIFKAFVRLYKKNNGKNISKDALKDLIRKYKDILNKMTVEFEKIDKNGDGLLDTKELAAFFEKKGKE